MKRRILCAAITAAAVCLSTACTAYCFDSGSDNTEPIVTAAKAAAADAPTSADTDSDDSWQLTLVNGSNPLPEEHDIALTELSNGRKVDERIYPDLQAMFDAARAEGLSPEVSEGYRTYTEQQEMMQQKINELKEQGFSGRKAKKKAKELVAQPGTSEHELGLAVDINPVSDSEDPWPLYSWLADNAWEYGFILRYLQGKQDITGIDYEPWHYRYVGRQAADEIYSRGVTLEEYLGKR